LFLFPPTPRVVRSPEIVGFVPFISASQAGGRTDASPSPSFRRDRRDFSKGSMALRFSIELYSPFFNRQRRGADPLPPLFVKKARCRLLTLSFTSVDPPLLEQTGRMMDRNTSFLFFSVRSPQAASSPEESVKKFFFAIHSSFPPYQSRAGRPISSLESMKLARGSFFSFLVSQEERTLVLSPFVGAPSLLLGQTASF